MIFLLASAQLLTNSKHPYSNPIQRLFRDDFDSYKNPPVVFKYHTERRLRHIMYCTFIRIFPASSEGRKPEKSTSDREGSQYRNVDVASGTIHRISKGFQRKKQNLCVYFSLRPGGKI